jgi:hypothetical protein
VHGVRDQVVEIVLQLDVLVVLKHRLFLARLHGQLDLFLPESRLHGGDHIEEELFVDALLPRFRVRLPIRQKLLQLAILER